MTIITLTTDFGLKDGFTGVMKGVIAGIAPHAQIVDISHLVPAQDVFEGALVLGRSIPYFPDGSIHVAVVDPGVGTHRRPIVAHLGNQFFVGPDNGLCTFMHIHTLKQSLVSTFYFLDKPAFWLKNISHVFHGRDIFAPVAAHLANGTPLGALGTQIYDPVQLAIATPQRHPLGWHGEVIHIDHFGNIATNIMEDHLQSNPQVSIDICGHTIHGLVHTFGERQPGNLIALFGSSGNLVISVVNGNAAIHLGASLSDPVEVKYLHR